MEIGERIQTLKQLFNFKQGADPRSFKVNDRVLGRLPQLKGANRGRTMDIEKMIGDYWRQFGWDAGTGKPAEARVSALGIRGRSGAPAGKTG